jgi:hypothetical protein
MREENSKSVKSEMQMGDNKHHGNPGNHQRILGETIFQHILKILKKWTNF